MKLSSKISLKQLAKEKNLTEMGDVNLNQLFSEGLNFHQLGLLEQAKSTYLKVLSIQSKHFDAMHLLGMIEFQAKNYLLAKDLITRALGVFKESELAHCNLGNVYSAISDYESALTHYNQSILIKFYHVEAHFNKAIALQKSNRSREALFAYEVSIILKPDFVPAYSNLGTLLSDLGNLSHSISYFNKAITILPFSAELYSNRGVVLNKLGLSYQAIQNYEFAISIKPDYVEGHSNLGVSLQDLRRDQDAFLSFQNAILIDPNDAESHFNLSLTLLRSGDLQNGLNEFEWRWNSPSSSCFKTKREFAKPLWLGQSSLSDKTILIYAEQGLGDSIQFVRYIEFLVKLGAKVIFEVQSPLVELFMRIPATLGH